MQQRQLFMGSERFGFLKTGKPFGCKACSASQPDTATRLYDNDTKTGPYCLPCARSVMSQTNGNEAQRSGLDNDSTNAAIYALTEAVKELASRATLTGKAPETNETIDPLAPAQIDLEALQNRMLRLETFIAQQFGNPWEQHKRTYKI